MENKIITLRSVFGKMKEYHFQPCKLPNGANLPFVKKVRYDSLGNAEMILNQDEIGSPESEYFLPEDADIKVVDGQQFNLNDPMDYNLWMAIKDSDLIVPTRDARDANGNLLIDGDAKRYGIAELYVDVPGEESERSVSKKKKINKAWTFIENDSTNGMLTKCKLLGKEMYNAPISDVADFLYQRAEKNPDEIIELYTSSDMSLKLLIIDAKAKHIIYKKDGMYVYAENTLGATDDALILFLKMPQSKAILDAIKFETYPEYAPTPSVDEIVEKATAPKKTTKSSK